jgi:hypothetical protein
MFSLFFFSGFPTPSILEFAKMETRRKGFFRNTGELEIATWHKEKAAVYFLPFIEKKLDEQFFKLFMTHIVVERRTTRDKKKQKRGILLFFPFSFLIVLASF